MAINVSVQYNGALLLGIILLTRFVTPLGNPFKRHVVALSSVYVTVYYHYHVFVFADFLVSLHGDY